MATELLRVTVSTPRATDVSAPATPSLSASFRLNSMDSMSMSSMSFNSLYDASPILRDFQEMTLSLTDESDDDETCKGFPEISPAAEHIVRHSEDEEEDDEGDSDACSLFAFATNHDEAALDQVEREERRGRSSRLVSFRRSDRDTEDEDEEEENASPFLMGLALNIPHNKVCSGFDDQEDIDILAECETEEEYSNNYLDGDEEYEFSSQSHDEDDECVDCVDGEFMMKRYKLIENLGIGAFGIVDKVLDCRTNEYMAIKQSRSIGDDVLKQFRNESTILQEFADCEHIINMSEHGRNIDVNQICIALEYMDIGSLCNITHYSVPQIRHICKSVLLALQAMHTKLYVHNDIKPDNILISRSGQVKLIDFGCTMQMASSDTPLTKSIGSIRYLSCEKRFSSPTSYTTQSDIYSLGVSIAEIFNAQHIYKKSTYDHYFATSTPTLLNSEDATFNDFIAKCVDSDPAQRFTATQLLAHPFVADHDVYNAHVHFD